MSRNVGAVAGRFREKYTFPHQALAHYFPGHMARGMEQMQRKMKLVDCIVEVHDARIPLTGRNMHFESKIMVRPHLLLLNKMDLADMRHQKQLANIAQKEYNIKHILYTNCKEYRHPSIKTKLMNAILNIMETEPRFHRSEADDYNIMVIGVPNVGKSSLINALRHIHLGKGKATKVGAEAGITRSVLERIKVRDSPKMYLYDSPGIMPPKIDNMEIGMKLALCGTIRDHLIGEDIITDYMLYWLNKHEKFGYVKKYRLAEPTDDIYVLLNKICKDHDLILKRKSATGNYEYRPAFTHAAKMLLKSFRLGELGKVNLDVDQCLEMQLANSAVT